MIEKHQRLGAILLGAGETHGGSEKCSAGLSRGRWRGAEGRVGGACGDRQGDRNAINLVNPIAVAAGTRGIFWRGRPPKPILPAPTARHPHPLAGEPLSWRARCRGAAPPSCLSRCVHPTAQAGAACCCCCLESGRTSQSIAFRWIDNSNSIPKKKKKMYQLKSLSPSNHCPPAL